MNKSLAAKPAWIIRTGAMQRLAVALAVAVCTFLAQPGFVSWHTRAVVSWDLGVLVYLCLAWWLIARNDASTTRDHALSQDQSGYIIFLFVLGASCASMVAIGFVVSTIGELAFWSRAWHLTLTIDALLSSWLLIQTVFAFHYARSEQSGASCAAALTEANRKRERTHEHLETGHAASNARRDRSAGSTEVILLPVSSLALIVNRSPHEESNRPVYIPWARTSPIRPSTGRISREPDLKGLLSAADSSGRRNSWMKSFSRCFVVWCFPRAFVEAPSDRVELGLRVP